MSSSPGPGAGVSAPWLSRHPCIGAVGGVRALGDAVRRLRAVFSSLSWESLPATPPAARPTLDAEQARLLAAVWPQLMRGEWPPRRRRRTGRLAAAGAALALLAAGLAGPVRPAGVLPGLPGSQPSLSRAAETLVPEGAGVLAAEEQACRWGPRQGQACAVLQVAARPDGLEERAAAYEARARDSGWTVTGRLLVQDRMAVHLRRPGYAAFVEVRDAAKAPECAGARAASPCADLVHVRRTP